jgi:hypothetical protein
MIGKNNNEVIFESSLGGRAARRVLRTSQTACEHALAPARLLLSPVLGGRFWRLLLAHAAGDFFVGLMLLFLFALTLGKAGGVLAFGDEIVSSREG